ncbi:MAG: SUMF1/EgtB/PvdO family nonheme iron enzyme [Chloroflexi bacterium]|nr:SUMF1/EgtB/PvdO family nonheme iron enzyme [Chloroflexota bacterium]
MTLLPQDLQEEIVALCQPHFRLESERDSLLAIPLGQWPGFDKINRGGSPYSFTVRLVNRLPGEQLQALLRSLLVGHQQEQQIESLCQRIDAAQGLVSNPAHDPFARYHQERVGELSGSRYQLNDRFVQLTLLLDQGPDAQGIRFVHDAERGKFNSLAALLNDVEDRALVLLGQPGSGKTTLLRRLQLERAWAELEPETTIGQTVFFVSLNSYRGDRPGQPPPEPITWLEQEWRIRYPNLPAFANLFQAGRILLLLDGLNEMPHRDKTDYRERIGHWQAFLQRTRHYGNRVLFSCRSLDYSAPLGSEAAPVRQVQVEPLTPSQIEAFLDLHLAERSEPVWATLQRDSQQMALFASPFFLRLLTDQIATTGDMPAGQAALLTGFVRRTLYREVAERNHRLFAPDNLLSEDDVQQVLQMPNAWVSPFDLPTDGILIEQLENLAFRMQDGRSTHESGQVRLLEKTARALLDVPQARDIIAAGIQLNALDKELAKREIAFYHQLLQEYFAARLLAQTPEPERAAVPWHEAEITPSLADTLANLDISDPLPAAPTTGWEETTLLAAAMTPHQEQFVADLMSANLPLAARCAATVEVNVSADLLARLKQALLHRAADPQADLRARITAAEALGELGDPRFERRRGPYGDYLQPLLAAVPAGSYAIGDDESQYDDEKSAHDVEIEAFEMGVFPVTNAEYRLFIEAGGYEDEQWWQTKAALAWLRGKSDNESQKAFWYDTRKTLSGMSDESIRAIPNITPEQMEQFIQIKNLTSEELEKQLEEAFPAGKIYSQPEYWEDSRFNLQAQPVVGITWFEARAYCAWLSAQTGWEVKLPTEVEWETAARGKVGREYAYGDKYDNGRCNTFETHIRRTTPVGIFPNGHTLESIHDLSGNVWEWTSTIWGQENRSDFPYPYDAKDGRENIEDGASRRVLRGGSWLNSQLVARAASRDYSFPDDRYYVDGFRVVVVRRPPSHHAL